jgi:hypothetical protein
MPDFTGFPMCRDGDVLITLSTSHRMQLHSEILKRHSTLFSANILDHNYIGLSNAAKKRGITIRWRFDLKYAPGNAGCGHLEPVVTGAPLRNCECY